MTQIAFLSVNQPIIKASFRWVYFVPVIHFLICLSALSGYVVSGLQPLGILFTFIDIVDLPISLVYIALAWNYGVLAAIWLVVVGTLWWYLLCRTAEKWIATRKTVRPTP
jgi:hypothetical protein